MLNKTPVWGLIKFEQTQKKESQKAYLNVLEVMQKVENEKDAQTKTFDDATKVNYLMLWSLVDNLV